jgi:hypothetical protein
MNYSAILLSGFLSVFATASVAQQPREPIYLDAMSGARIDLDAVSGSGPRKVVFARVSFVENVGGYRRAPNSRRLAGAVANGAAMGPGRPGEFERLAQHVEAVR